MDPNKALDIINDRTEDKNIRSAHLHYLAEWIAKGGSVPIGSDYVHAPDGEWDRHDYLLATAINVAIHNSDLSGLEGLGYKVRR